MVGSDVIRPGYDACVADGESKGERLDRELSELLQELRVLLPGVQVLLAFLLIVPFNARFAELEDGEQALYLASLILAAVATVCLVAPSAFHRILFRDRDKEWLIKASNGLALAGTFFLAVAISSAVFLVCELIYGSRLASAVAGGLGLLFLVVWYVVPLVRRARN